MLVELDLNNIQTHIPRIDGDGLRIIINPELIESLIIRTGVAQIKMKSGDIFATRDLATMCKLFEKRSK